MKGSTCLHPNSLRNFIWVQFRSYIQGVPKAEFLSLQILWYFIIFGPSQQFWAPWAILGPMGHFGPFWSPWSIMGPLGHFGPFWALWAILGHSGLWDPIWPRLSAYVQNCPFELFVWLYRICSGFNSSSWPWWKCHVFLLAFYKQCTYSGIFPNPGKIQESPSIQIQSNPSQILALFLQMWTATYFQILWLNWQSVLCTLYMYEPRSTNPEDLAELILQTLNI